MVLLLFLSIISFSNVVYGFDDYIKPESYDVFDDNEDIGYVGAIMFDSSENLHVVTYYGDHLIVNKDGNTLTDYDPRSYRLVGMTLDNADGLYLATMAKMGIEVLYFGTTDVVQSSFAIDSNDSSSGHVLGMAVDSSDNLYVGNPYLGKIFVFDDAGNALYDFDVNGASNWIFESRLGSFALYENNLYVPVLFDNVIQVFSLDGTLLRSFDLASPEYSGHIAMDAEGNIYVTDHTGDKIEIYSNDGNLLYKVEIKDLDSDKRNFTVPAITVDESGVIYAVHKIEGTIHVIDPGDCIISNTQCTLEHVPPPDSPRTVFDASLDVTNPRIVNSLGEPISESIVNQPVHVKADIFNDGDKSRSFVYVIKGENSNDDGDDPLDDNWVHVNVESQWDFSPSIKMLPDTTGNYTVTIELWSDLEIKSLYAKPIELQLRVVDDSATTPDSSVDSISKPILDFVDTTKDPRYYIDRYNNEESYKDWFDNNYPDYTIEEAVGYKEIMPIVPSWIKNNAKWWVDGNLGDSDFASGIQYLVQEKIIDVSVTVESKPILDFVDTTKDPRHYIDRYNNEESYKDWFDNNYPDYSIEEGIGFVNDDIPSWVKNNAGWWADGLLSEDDFLQGIEYLVEKQIIKVN